MIGKVIKLFITKSDKTRDSVKSVLVNELGIKDDKFYDKDPMRSILITATNSYQLSSENSIELSYGSLGENILIDISPYHLLSGQKLIIGNTTLEITQNCTLCKGLSEVNPKLPKLLAKDRGIFAKVVEGNYQINIGDKVEILHY